MNHCHVFTIPLCRFSFSSLCLLSIDRLFLEGDWVIAQASRDRKKPIVVRSHINKLTESSSFQNTESIQRKKRTKNVCPSCTVIVNVTHRVGLSNPRSPPTLSYSGVGLLYLHKMEVNHRYLSTVSGKASLFWFKKVSLFWSCISTLLLLYISRTGQCTYGVGP